MSIRDRLFEVSPTFMTRLVADRGCIMNGGLAQVGSVGVTVATRSCTSCRARSRSVPGSKMSTIDDSWGTDLERITSSPATPLSASSSGTVTRASTSDEERPRQGVWISTRGGANSGKTSTGIELSCPTPKNIIAPAAATTRKRNFRLDPTIQRIMAQDVLRSVPAANADLGAEQLGHSDRHDRGAGGRTVREDRLVPLDLVDADGVPYEDEGFRARVGPGLALRVVDHRGVGDDLSLLAADARVTDRGRLDAEPLGRLPGQRDAAEVGCLDVLDLGGLDLAGRARRLLGTCRELETGEQQQRDHPAIPMPHRASPLCSSYAFALTLLVVRSTCGPLNGSGPGRRDPRRRYSVGTTNRLSSVEVTRPPRTTTAMGRTISRPGSSPSTTSGTRASAAASAAARIGTSRSRAPRRTSPGPTGSPSSRPSCR